MTIGADKNVCSANRLPLTPAAATKLIVQTSVGLDTATTPMRFSKSAKTTSVFSTSVIYHSGKLAQIARHRCALVAIPIGQRSPVAAAECAKRTVETSADSTNRSFLTSRCLGTDTLRMLAGLSHTS